MWRVVANIFNKQPWTAENGWCYSLGVGRGANNASPQKRVLLRNVRIESLGPGLLLWYELGNEKGS